jgi:uncharacterized protein YdhG (YjbR/CyaY superfamily)
MQSKAQTVEQYLAELPEDRRDAIQAVRKTILKNLPNGYEEGMQYGMIGYYVPHSIYPDGYHCDPKQPLPFASLASQKNHMAVYLVCIYADPEQVDWFVNAWKATGKKLDMGKSCVRFKKIEEVPLDVIGKAVKRVPVKRFIDFYETALKTTSRRPNPKTAKKSTKKKTVKKKAGAKKKATATRKKTTSSKSPKRTAR